MLLFVTFSKEAQNYFEEHGTANVFNKGFSVKGLKKGSDWDIKEFGTVGEMGAYTRGLEDGNGWSNEVMWQAKPVDYSKV